MGETSFLPRQLEADRVSGGRSRKCSDLRKEGLALIPHVFHWTLCFPKKFAAHPLKIIVSAQPKNRKIRKEMGGYRRLDKDSSGREERYKMIN